MPKIKNFVFRMQEWREKILVFQPHNHSYHPTKSSPPRCQFAEEMAEVSSSIRISLNFEKETGTLDDMAHQLFHSIFECPFDCNRAALPQALFLVSKSIARKWIYLGINSTRCTKPQGHLWRGIHHSSNDPS